MGTIHPLPEHSWPSLGQSLPAGFVFGQLEPRLLPADRLSITTQLATARADVNASMAAVAAAQSAYDRTKALNADDKNVSDKAAQEAEARLRTEQAKGRAARANASSLEGSLQPGGAIGYRPLLAERRGDVVEVFAQPGEAIEQGAPIVRMTRFDRLLVRVDLPMGEHVSPADRNALVIPAGFEEQTPLPAERVAVAGAIDTHTQGISLLYRLKKTYFGLRPGAAVTVLLSKPGAPVGGVLIPPASAVQQAGKSWAYVQISPERFVRKLIPPEAWSPSGLIAVSGFAPGDRVVVVGAQSLLSEEFKSQNEIDEQ
jgi:hypothetical protein